ncbi:hypothetical protein [Pseudoxanthomonas putridarboris]|uniref:Outer membrane protein beta-barrel domain-containing protein n=1 Tax=Pseudoxanthomonas putridarboris TaxID=752605 RepID=A0ABU9J3Q4_9GAMM
MKNRPALLSVSAFAAFAMAPSPAAAEDLSPVDSFFVSAGVYRSSNDVKLRWHPSSGAGAGSRVDLKRDLGIDTDGTDPFFEIGGSFGHGRNGHRHKFEAFRYSYDGGSSLTLDGDYVIGDGTYVDGADFEGDLDVEMTGLSYTWFFHNRDGHAFGVGVGAIRYDITASFAAAARADEEIEAVYGSVSEAAWVPQIHVEYARSLSRHWRIGLDASYVKKSGGSVEGDAVDIGAKVDYLPWQHFGFSLRYNYNDVELDFKKSRFTGDIDVKSRGPQLIATYRF